MTRILRQLSAIYLSAASAFVVAAVLAQHPDWAEVARQTGIAVKDFTVETAIATNDRVIQPGYAYAKDKGGAFAEWAGNQLSPPVQVAKKGAPKHKPPVQVAKNTPPPQQAKPAAPPPPPAETLTTEAPEAQAPVAIARDEPKPELAAPEQKKPPVVVAQNTKPLRPAIIEDKADVVASAQPPIKLAPLPDIDVRAMVSRAGPGPGELIRVAERLKSSLTEELLNNFELFLYVSKADTGVWAQRMYVFEKKPSGDLAMLYNWPVSTGRDRWEFDVHGKRQNSFTPQGYYELDPQRMHARYHSGQWNQPMPYAMFFNWEQNGYQTGLAIHGATSDDVALLGARASAGCVRLAPENARLLFNVIKAQYRGLAPKFAYDKRTATMDNNGLLLHDKNGKIQFADGYKVLVFIENYGGNDVVAALF